MFYPPDFLDSLIKWIIIWVCITTPLAIWKLVDIITWLP